MSIPFYFKTEYLNLNEKEKTIKGFDPKDHYYSKKTKDLYEMIIDNRISASRTKILSRDINAERAKDYFCFNSFDSMWKLVSEWKSPHFHELFTPSKIFKENVFTSIVYDIDKTLNYSSESINEEEKKIEEAKIQSLIKNINEKITFLIIGLMNSIDKESYKYLTVKVLIQKSSGNDFRKKNKIEKKYKISFHVNIMFSLKYPDRKTLIIFSNIHEVKAILLYAILNLDSAAENISCLIKNRSIGERAGEVGEISNSQQNAGFTTSVVDFQIYGENRSIRCLFSSNRNDKNRKLIVDSFKEYLILKGGTSGYFEEKPSESEDDQSLSMIIDNNNDNMDIKMVEVKDLSNKIDKKIFYHSLNSKPIHWIKEFDNKIQSMIEVKGFIREEEKALPPFKLSSSLPKIFETILETVLIYYTNKSSSFSSRSSIKDYDRFKGLISFDNVMITKRKMVAIQTILSLLEKWVNTEIKKNNKGKVCQGVINYKTDYIALKYGAVEQLKHYYDLKSGSVKANHPNDSLMLNFSPENMRRLCIENHYILFDSTFKFCFINDGGKEHQSNHVYYLINLWPNSNNDKPIWYQKCYDEKCAAKTQEKNRTKFKKHNINNNYNNNNNNNIKTKIEKDPKGKSDIFQIPKEDLVMVDEIRNILLDVEIHKVNGFICPPTLSKASMKRNREIEEEPNRKTDNYNISKLHGKIQKEDVLPKSLKTIFDDW